MLRFNQIFTLACGVPHIHAATLTGLYYGYGYALAQDQLYQIEMFRRTYWGRLSEICNTKRIFNRLVEIDMGGIFTHERF